MKRNQCVRIVQVLVLAVLSFSWGVDQAFAESVKLKNKDPNSVLVRRKSRVTNEQRRAAAARAAAKRLPGQKGPVARGAPGPIVPGPVPMPLAGTRPNYLGGVIPNWAYTPPLRKFVDGLPGLYVPGVNSVAAADNNLGQYIPVAIPDQTAYPGSDYYEIELGQYTEQMHSDLPPTTLRGYRQTNTADPNVSQFRYLGPLIIAQKDRPVRVKFTNSLPTGAGGDLFLPVDTTAMGAGMGPLGMNVTPGNPMNYTENRATLHLHGGNVPWISDGTQHQWITPAGELTDYPKGVSASNVPDMLDPGAGSMTFYYSNQQSARLMFYHDHAFGITRLNVYAGEAAGYLLTDAVEQDLVTRGIIPAEQIPLIIQDKTFVDANTLPTTDPTWNWGTQPGFALTGNLWLPHVYMPNQNTNDLAGINAMGRWDYGPWIFPPWPVDFPPITLPDGTQEPNLPNNSMGMEAFMDTPVINGTAYPVLNVEPRTYRFRILSAANDRFWNLQLLRADPAQTSPVASVGLSEVKLVPFAHTQPDGVTPWPTGWPTPDNREGGIPDPQLLGPKFIQIGNECGFLPAPVVWDNVPIGWDLDPMSATTGNVLEHNLFLGPAERADVIVDFSQFAGQTLILYNDAPAPVPSIDGRYDYYTGHADLTAIGGDSATYLGYGPNTRTIMQIKVANTAPAPAFDQPGTTTDGLGALEAEFTSTASTSGVFVRSHDPILVPQAPYNSAYNANFPSGTNAYARIQDTSLTFTPLGGAAPVTIPFRNKCLAEFFGTDYGRMNALIGVMIPFNWWTNIEPVITYRVQDPVTEIMDDSVTISPVTAGDGTQLWHITHNGVDTHPIHFHLFNVQVVNRVDWAGVVKPPELNELGWKETLRMNPIEDIIVALRPVSSKQPFGVPDSIRPLDPTMPLGSTAGFRGLDPTNGTQITVTNQIYNFGWEYVWHCHILSHEEMDMMRPIQFNVARNLPAAPALTVLGPTVATLNWTDATPASAPATLGNPANEVGFRIERADNGGAFAVIGAALANATSYTDATILPLNSYSYRVVAYNAAGNSVSNVATLGGPVEAIVDNADPGTSRVGTWSTSTSLPAQRWGANYAWSNTNGSFTFPVSLNAGTRYAVYGRWTSATNRRTAVAYEIRDGVTLLGTVNVNQQTNGGTWNLLGAYTFTGGAASVAVLSAVGSLVTVADAVRFVPLPAPTEVIMDNADPGTSRVGTWSVSTGLPAQRYGANYEWRNASGSFKFTPNLVPGATYQVYAWWTAASNRRAAVPYEIRDGATLLGTVNVNQQTNGGMWNLLGTFTFTGTPSVTVVSAAGGVSVADAVKFTPVP